MPTIILENPETGETRELHTETGRFSAPWRIKGFIPDPMPKGQSAPDHKTVRIATWATKFGLPVPQFLDTVRWLIGKDCPFCELGTKVLRRLDALGQDRAQEFINRILEAKSRNDTNALEQIRAEVTNLIGAN